MKAQEKEILRKALLAEKERILAASKHPEVDLELGHGDLADQSASLMERETTLGRAQHDAELLSQIEEALELLEKGEYGICEVCRQPIPQKRLLINPTARYCTKCQEEIERREMARK